mmetsp:Transcript_12627/g.34578  ORF Transcript_12627/g.34578 Transcript_12627/m.34578 type:complete len:126 (+) Transcript_12627:466-843(+)
MRSKASSRLSPHGKVGSAKSSAMANPRGNIPNVCTWIGHASNSHPSSLLAVPNQNPRRRQAQGSKYAALWRSSPPASKGRSDEKEMTLHERRDSRKDARRRTKRRRNGRVRSNFVIARCALRRLG